MLYLIAAAVLWGGSFPVITFALRDISPFLFVFLRFFAAFLVLALVCRSPRDLRRLFRRDLVLISIPNALSFILQFPGQELTTASKMALFVNSSPIGVAVLSVVFLKERLGLRQLAAMWIALAGVLVTSTRLQFSDFSSINLGDVLGLGVGFCWAVFIVFSRGALARYGAVELARALYFWTAMMTLPLVAFEPVRFAWKSVPAILYLTVFATLVAYGLYLKGIRSVSSLSTSIIILVEVAVAFGIASAFLGDSFTAVEGVGVAMLLSGVLIIAGRGERPPGRAPASLG